MQKETRPGPRLFTRVVEAVRTNKKLELGVYAGLFLLAAALYLVTLLPETGREKAAASGKRDAVSEAQSTEQRLTEVLSCIRGAGKVAVMITYETGGELVTAMTTSVNSNASETSDGDKVSVNTETTESSEPATVGSGSGNEPIILMEREPVVRGVLVVAEGAADIRVKLDLQRAVQAVLDVPPSKIEVFESAISLP